MGNEACLIVAAFTQYLSNAPHSFLVSIDMYLPTPWHESGVIDKDSNLHHPLCSYKVMDYTSLLDAPHINSKRSGVKHVKAMDSHAV